MKAVEPRVRLIAHPEINWNVLMQYLESQGIDLRSAQITDVPSQVGSSLSEFMGRLCYRSFDESANKNVTRIRRDSLAYIRNLIDSDHGSVFEHAQYTFVISGVSRVFTHELVRHRVGTAISQESGRYVAQEEMGFWIPDWAEELEKNDQEFAALLHSTLSVYEQIQRKWREYFQLDAEGVPFAEKKHKTSFIRRFLPEGRSNAIGWSANLRTLRHTIPLRTSGAAEEEIRLVFDQIARLMKDREPLVFQDFFLHKDTGEWHKLATS